MYTLSCDGFPLLDLRANDLVLVNPKVKLEVNTVGEGSFTIYKSHPYYDKLKKMKSVFEVKDDDDVIFRGRATGDTIDFDLGKAVDLEGSMAYFNDSIVRPFDFPADYERESDYISASYSGNVVKYFLQVLIENHNSQVQEFQRFKLGEVTVSDPNNYITRSNSDYASTWETLKSKLFGSSLGGYLCIRYEEDGNYIDYLSEFTEKNSQRILFGENLLNLVNKTEAVGTYSAMIPVGADGLTIASLPDGDITDDIVKSGDTIYSKKAVDEYGWIYAPPSESKWDDVTLADNLLSRSVDQLAGKGIFLANTLEATAVDLHFTDKQIMSLRIYKNVDVFSEPHEIEETVPLAKLELDLLNPQNTKIAVGETAMTLTDKTAVDLDNVVQEVNQTANNYFNSLQVKVVESVESELYPGEYRVFGKVNGLTVNLVTVEDDNANEYMFEFIPSETFTGLTITPDVRWPITPTIIPGKVHQVSILRSIGVLISA